MKLLRLFCGCIRTDDFFTPPDSNNNNVGADIAAVEGAKPAYGALAPIDLLGRCEPANEISLDSFTESATSPFFLPATTRGRSTEEDVLFQEQLSPLAEDEALVLYGAGDISWSAHEATRNSCPTVVPCGCAPGTCPNPECNGLAKGFRLASQASATRHGGYASPVSATKSQASPMRHDFVTLLRQASNRGSSSGATTPAEYLGGSSGASPLGPLPPAAYPRLLMNGRASVGNCTALAHTTPTAGAAAHGRRRRASAFAATGADMVTCGNAVAAVCCAMDDGGGGLAGPCPPGLSRTSFGRCSSSPDVCPGSEALARACSATAAAVSGGTDSPAQQERQDPAQPQEAPQVHSVLQHRPSAPSALGSAGTAPQPGVRTAGHAGMGHGCCCGPAPGSRACELRAGHLSHSPLRPRQTAAGSSSNCSPAQAPCGPPDGCSRKAPDADGSYQRAMLLQQLREQHELHKLRQSQQQEAMMRRCLTSQGEGHMQGAAQSVPGLDTVAGATLSTAGLASDAALVDLVELANSIADAPADASTSLWSTLESAQVPTSVCAGRLRSGAMGSAGSGRRCDEGAVSGRVPPQVLLAAMGPLAEEAPSSPASAAAMRTGQTASGTVVVFAPEASLPAALPTGMEAKTSGRHPSTASAPAGCVRALPDGLDTRPDPWDLLLSSSRAAPSEESSAREPALAGQGSMTATLECQSRASLAQESPFATLAAALSSNPAADGSGASPSRMPPGPLLLNASSSAAVVEYAGMTPVSPAGGMSGQGQLFCRAITGLAPSRHSSGCVGRIGSVDSAMAGDECFRRAPSGGAGVTAGNGVQTSSGVGGSGSSRTSGGLAVGMDIAGGSSMRASEASRTAIALLRSAASIPAIQEDALPHTLQPSKLLPPGCDVASTAVAADASTAGKKTEVCQTAANDGGTLLDPDFRGPEDVSTVAPSYTPHSCIPAKSPTPFTQSAAPQLYSPRNLPAPLSFGTGVAGSSCYDAASSAVTTVPSSPMPALETQNMRLEDGLVSDPLMLIDGLEQLSYVTSGAYAAVYKGTWDGVPMGIKFLTSTSLDLNAPAVKEALLGPGLEHVNIIRTYTTRVARIDDRAVAQLRSLAAAAASAVAFRRKSKTGLRRLSVGAPLSPAAAAVRRRSGILGPAASTVGAATDTAAASPSTSVLPNSSSQAASTPPPSLGTGTGSLESPAAPASPAATAWQALAPLQYLPYSPLSTLPRFATTAASAPCNAIFPAEEGSPALPPTAESDMATNGTDGAGVLDLDAGHGSRSPIVTVTGSRVTPCMPRFNFMQPYESAREATLGPAAATAVAATTKAAAEQARPQPLPPSTLSATVSVTLPSISELQPRGSDSGARFALPAPTLRSNNSGPLPRPVGPPPPWQQPPVRVSAYGAGPSAAALFRVAELGRGMAAERMLDVLHTLGVLGPTGHVTASAHYVTAVVMELADVGNLDTFSRAAAPCALATAVELLRQVACGMSYLHAHGLVHGDLKPANVLLLRESASGRLLAKVADFGLSGLSGQLGTSGGADTCGTIAYSAPERLAQEGSAEQPADVYSFGICLQQLVSAERPFEDLTYGQIMFGVLCRKMRPEWPTGRCDPLQPLYDMCCHEEASKRPTFDQIVNWLDSLALERAASSRR